jgi:uncharacterized RDD family membrane protein YckC
MGHPEESAHTSVAPPNWTAPPIGVSSPIALSDPGADAAVRWRISAAVIDNLIVYCGYLGLCGLLHWQVAAPAHLVLLLVASVLYHLGLEARTGQTIGKRRYGIRVVSADGGPADLRAVTLRSVLRIVDQLPVAYVSGLVSMVRTGPARRQRIGDVAAGTMVVAVDRQAAARGTPGWMLPAATLLATGLSLLSVLAVVEAGRRPLDVTERAQFVSGCQNGPAAQLVDCTCLLNQLVAAGYDTPNQLRDLVAEEQSELASGASGPARAELTSAAGACRR